MRRCSANQIPETGLQLAAGSNVRILTCRRRSHVEIFQFNKIENGMVGLAKADNFYGRTAPTLSVVIKIADGPVSRILCGVATRMVRCKPRQSFL